MKKRFYNIGGSRRRRNLPTDELPFPVTEEILNLPGYKPRTRPQRLSGRPLTPWRYANQ